MTCLKYLVNVRLSEGTQISFIASKGNDLCGYIIQNIIWLPRAGWLETLRFIPPFSPHHEAIIFGQVIILFIWAQSSNLPGQHSASLLGFGVPVASQSFLLLLIVTTPTSPKPAEIYQSMGTHGKKRSVILLSLRAVNHSNARHANICLLYIYFFLTCFSRVQLFSMIIKLAPGSLGFRIKSLQNPGFLWSTPNLPPLSSALIHIPI